MSKQEKIREDLLQAVNRILLHNLVRPRDRACYLNPSGNNDYLEWLEQEVDNEILKPLDSQGVVVKVDSVKPPIVFKEKFEIEGKLLCMRVERVRNAYDMVGYEAVEPLIEPKCKQEWFKLRDQVITSGEICSKCHAVRTETEVE